MQLIGPYGNLSAEHVEGFRASKANAVWFHGFSAEHFDRCGAADAAACVEFRTFRGSYDEHPELRPIGAVGAPIRYGRLVQGICLSQHDFIAQREAELRGGMATFAPTGVWLDYLTYAGWFETPDPDLQESCFCTNCVAEFNESTGIDAEDPREILEHHAKAWHAHKCDRILSYGKRFASIIREARPGTIVGIYARPWFPDEFDGALTRIFGQDLERLAAVFDVVTPLLYATKSGRAADWIVDYMHGCRDFIPASARIEPIVDALDLPGNLEAIAAAGLRRERGSANSAGSESIDMPTGLQVFSGDQIFADRETVALFDRAARAILG